MAWIETTTPKTFTAQPEPPYLEIDLWQKGDDLYKCTQARTADEAFNESDWTPATSAEQAKADAQAAKDDASVAKALSERTASSFYADEEGAHIESEDGENALITQDGLHLRDGETQVVSLSKKGTSMVLDAPMNKVETKSVNGLDVWSTLNEPHSILSILQAAASVFTTDIYSEVNNIAITAGAFGGLSIFINAEGRSGKLADWVTDSGTSGIWTYRKYANGDAECEVTLSFQGSFVNQLSPIFWTDAISLDFPAGLFSAAPRIQLTAEGGGVLSGASVNTKTKDSFTFYFYRFGSSAAANVRVNIRATS